MSPTALLALGLVVALGSAAVLMTVAVRRAVARRRFLARVAGRQAMGGRFDPRLWEARLAALDRGGRLAALQRAAGQEVSMLALLRQAMLAVMVAAVALALLDVPMLLAPPVGMAALALLLLREAARQRRRFEAQLAEAIGLMVRGLKSGAPVIDAVAAAGRELPEPLGPALARVVDEVRVGRSLEEALWRAARIHPSPSFRFLIVTIALQRETGGNLARTLSSLETMIRQRQAMTLKVRALSSEARASALIIGALPFVMGGLVAWVAPDYFAPMLKTGAGLVLLGLALSSLVSGLLLMNRMARIRVS